MTRPKTAEELAAAILSEMPGDFVGEIEALLPFAEALLACKEALESHGVNRGGHGTLCYANEYVQKVADCLGCRALESLAALPLMKETQE